MGIWGAIKDAAGAVKGAAEDAVDWTADTVGAVVGWAADQASDAFPFLPSDGGGYSAGAGGAPYGATTNVYCGNGRAGSGGLVCRRRYEIEGDFLLDTYEGRVWRYDANSETFARIMRELSESELDVVESALGIFGQIHTKFGERITETADDSTKSLLSTLKVAAESSKRDIAAYRKALANRAARPR